MKSTDSLNCPRCGARMPVGATDHLCPACLMSGALKPPIDETVSTALDPSPPPDEPIAFPCEFGGYRLHGLLGRGGMGTVYDAEHIATGRRVALKRLGYQLDSPQMRRRFLREGRLAAGVNHPNSLYIFGSEEIEHVPVITMEIAGSGTLKDKITKRGPLPITESVDAILDVIAGLEAAFAAGVLHRDIKPSNCFVSPDGSVKIGDFGLSVSTLAKDDSYVTATGVIMGTPAYASPEQLRGDDLDVRADIYSVGATLFTLLTNRAPFEGGNVVQVVANAVNQEPKPLTELRKDVPAGLARVVGRCLAKEPDGRFADYTALRNALLPFSSSEPEPASIVVRVSAGWIDFLIAFLPPYIALMFLVGAEKLIVRPLVERTLPAAKYYLVLLGLGFLYFAVVEGIWGAGLGKWLKGLRVVRANGRPPGIARALIRILIPILCMEGVRMPLMMASGFGPDWTGLQVAWFVIAANICGWIPVLLMLRARRDNAFATAWDLVSGTRVVVKPKGAVRPVIEPVVQPEIPAPGTELMGPYQVIHELVPGEWILGADPMLRRQVWLLRRTSSQPSPARQNVARSGRLRWLQKVDTTEATWDVFEATRGIPFLRLVEQGKRVPWGNLRHWLHDLAWELWDATRDHTLPAKLSLDQVWISTTGRAILLDVPWPDVTTPAEPIPVAEVAGQQRFLNAVAGFVDSTSLPLHARPTLQNLATEKFEKLSFLAGVLRGSLDKPVEVNQGIRAGSILLLPLYVWMAVLVGHFHDKPWNNATGGHIIISALAVLGAIAFMQLLGLPSRSTAGHSIFRLAVVNANGEPAGRSLLLVRWAIVWLPLFVPVSIMAWLFPGSEGVAFIPTLALLLLWVGAAVYAVAHPHRGLHDQLAGTWVVRR